MEQIKIDDAIITLDAIKESLIEMKKVGLSPIIPTFKHKEPFASLFSRRCNRPRNDNGRYHYHEEDVIQFVNRILNIFIYGKAENNQGILTTALEFEAKIRELAGKEMLE